MDNIEQPEIDKYLGLYHKDFRLIRNASYGTGRLVAELIPFRYTFTIEDLDYVTATQVHLYLSQLTYILIARVLADSQYDGLSRFVTMGDFMDKMYAGRLFFVSVTEKMRKIIYKHETPINAELAIVSNRKLGGSLFSKIEFNIGDKACTGELLIGMELANNSKKI